MSDTKSSVPPSEGNSPKWKVKEPNLGIYRANLETLKQQKEMLALLQQHPEKPIALEEDIKVQDLKNPNLLVIVGFSSPYVLEAAKKTKKEMTFTVIIEPDLGVFHQTLRRYYVGDIMQKENIELLVGIPPEELGPYLYKAFTAQDSIGPRASRSMAPEIIADPFVYGPQGGKNHPMVDRVTKTVMDTVKQVYLSMGCAADSFSRWERMIENQPHIQNAYRVAPLFDQFSGLPAVVLGAGPSLKGFIDAYDRFSLRDRVLVIACDAALRKLLDHGIRPHIVTRCERKSTTIFDGISREDTKDLYYAAYPWCAPEYFDLFENTLALFRGNGVCKWSGYDPGEVNGGVSSANAGLELAYLLGCKDIILSGIDLCFLDGRSHIEGTDVEFDPEKSRAKWQEIPGNSGKPVTTIPVWHRCLLEYQGTLFKHQGKAKVWNTSLEGARIEGTEVQSWEDISRLISDVNPQKKPLEIIQSRIEKHTQNYETSFQAKKAELKKILEEFQHDLKKLFLNVEDLMLIAQREEEKGLKQMKAQFTMKEATDQLLQLRRNLANVYAEPCRQIDVFKQKYYKQELFTYSLIDICQIDIFTCENKIAALKNVIEIEYEREKAYIAIHMNFFQTLGYYAEQLLGLIERGPDYEIRAEVPHFETCLGDCEWHIVGEEAAE